MFFLNNFLQYTILLKSSKYCRLQTKNFLIIKKIENYFILIDLETIFEIDF